MSNTLITQLISALEALPLEEKIEQLNYIREKLHEVSPFKNQPIDFVRWVPKDSVKGNDYNPNSVAPPEMQLLECSIDEDGYTQPIVSWKNGDASYEIVDGFHRHRVGKECGDITARIHGYLPLTQIKAEKTGKADRIASTIRHNRARGKHSVDAMTEIVVELKKRNWSQAKISKHLGMDQDEILRLTTISGLTEMFKDESFSQSWDLDLDVEMERDHDLEIQDGGGDEHESFGE